MQIQFNYRYISDEVTFESHQYNFSRCIKQKIAYQIKDIGEVVHFAEMMQKSGYYVALYLPYEAATYFNPNMETVSINHVNVYAAAYAFVEFDNPENTLKQAYVQQCDFTFCLNHQTMIEHIKFVQKAIIEGNTYQVNYTTRLTDKIRLPIATLYNELQQGKNGFYSALIDTDEIEVASISPELFFQRGPFKGEQDIILSKPMKGTIARGETEDEDKKNLETLKHSAKDKAENVMIVDLLRNDIGRIAETGTVHVYQLFNIEQYLTVYQMTTMVTGRVSHTKSLLEILKALFPCGSITGAPKLNTMKYIKALEQVPRYIYCGTIGLLLPNGKSIFNVPIRTIQYINNQAVYGVGAGITIDSDPELEINEFKDKTQILERL
ncbi:anthranilate synthase component I family protein [Staphylococcus sp. ACRSN]|uniref:chorismate-binding protein n=1 Tax=Staphylococcus sp. ACRSN TaxID=2918214 RepID=UPI001EF220FE|nr:anthranilate synthase component I family protein [Staphylococcus sp. ACRSN]MCG7339749.1 anthranilate synthase component I family protein [Staphylococcus sp. ACRSN]